MKKRMLIIFFVVSLINIIIDLLMRFLGVCTNGEMLIFLLISSFIYFFINYVIYITIEMNAILRYAISMLLGSASCVIILLCILFNMKDDKNMMIGLMPIISLLGGFINWYIEEWSIKKKDK